MAIEDFDYILYKFKEREFIFYKDLTTKEIDRFLYEGCLPMFDDFLGEKFLIKLHFERSIIYPLIINPGKTVRRNSKKYKISIDYDFDGVYRGVTNQFKDICWFKPQLYEKIKTLICNKESLSSFHSFEVWNANNELVAGDIGVVIGSRYLSMTGFYSESGAGTVLLYCIGKILDKFNFEVWDLGMDLPYKERLGAMVISRKKFLDLVKLTRKTKISLKKEIFNCADLLNEIDIRDLL